MTAVYRKGFQPHGFDGFSKACPTCLNQGSKHCFKCKMEMGESGYEPKVAMTNGDRIRAMTDEELVDLINEFNICDNRTNEECKFNYGADCSECVLDWLKQPVEAKER